MLSTDGQEIIVQKAEKITITVMAESFKWRRLLSSLPDTIRSTGSIGINQTIKAVSHAQDYSRREENL